MLLRMERSIHKKFEDEKDKPELVKDLIFFRQDK